MSKDNTPYGGEGDGKIEVGKRLPKIPPQPTADNNDPRTGMPRHPMTDILIRDGEDFHAKVDTRTGLLSNGLPALDPAQFPQRRNGGPKGRRHRDGTTVVTAEDLTAVRYQCQGCPNPAHGHGRGDGLPKADAPSGTGIVTVKKG